MAKPKFRYGGYMNATGGSMASASSSYGSRPTSNNNRESYRSTGPSEAKTKSRERLSGTIRDTKAEAEANEGSYLNTMMPGGNITYREMNKGRAKTAYDASKKKQEAMQQAIALAYNVNKDDGSNRSTIDQSTSNFQNLDNDQKQQLIDSGFAAAESNGVLGGTFGAEIEMNKLKERLANAKTKGEKNDALAALDRLNANLNTNFNDPFGATNMQGSMGLLNFDPSAVYSFGSDIDRQEGQGTYLKDAFYDMQSPNLTTKAYTNYMNHIDAFGHSRQGGIGFYGGGGGGGYGGGGGGGDGGSSGGPPPRGGMPQGNPNDMFGSMSPLQQAMINTNAAKGFSQGYSRGGIVSLVK